MSMDDKFKKLVHISFIIFLCCVMYGVWVGFDDPPYDYKTITNNFLCYFGGYSYPKFYTQF